MSDCSAFARAVAGELKVTLTQPVNVIVDEITNDPGWITLQDGVAAKRAADAGKLVIGALKAADHNPPRPNGHVVVVTSDLAHGKYPTDYWDSLGGVGAKNQPVSWAWREADRDRVHYAARSV